MADKIQKAKEGFLKLLAEIAPEINPDEIDPDKMLRDQVDIDSMDFMRLIVKIHEKLGIDIPESDYAKLSTLNAITRYLFEKGVVNNSA